MGLLHGRMSLAEKQTVMESFREKEIDVLVATPVIEVGVDIPNADGDDGHDGGTLWNVAVASDTRARWSG